MITFKKLIIVISISIIFIICLGYVIKEITDSYSNNSRPEKTEILNNTTHSDSLSLIEIEKLFSFMEDRCIDTISTDVINIIVTGLDTRMGSGCEHADANHLIRIFPDSGKMEIISIPRGTYVKAGYKDTSGLNYLANIRAGKGRERYMNEIAKICSIPKVDYYIEFGFSQAIGLLGILGFKNNAVQTLRLLRSRQAFGLGDYQRSFNQGEFIRQMLLSKYKSITNLPADIAIRAGLILVNTDLSYSAVRSIIDRLNKSGFPKSDSVITHFLKPKMNYDFHNFDFLSKTSRDSLYLIVMRTAKNLEIDDGGRNNNGRINRRVLKNLNSAIKRAENDSLKFPKLVINNLERIFEQRTWYQITDTNLRYELMFKICKYLKSAYEKTNQPAKANSVNKVLIIEEYIKNKY
ncbi:MAG: hypothetical protein HZB41_04530 [Ignavibacteriae bacterium]|nr:hypothetical protein [Ignavibacteriota bacterium]